MLKRRHLSFEGWISINWHWPICQYIMSLALDDPSFRSKERKLHKDFCGRDWIEGKKGKASPYHKLERRFNIKKKKEEV